MYELKFSKYGEGECKYCGKNSSEIYAATVSQGEKLKKYLVCRDCAINLKKQVESRNAQEKAKSSSSVRTEKCPVCGNAVNAGETVCSLCGVSLIQQQGVDASYSSISKNTADYSINNTYYQSNAGQSYQQMYDQVSGSENKKYSDKYQKRGGYLSFFCVTQVLSCLSQFGLAAENSSSGKSCVVNIFLGVLFAVLAFFIIRGINHRDKSFLKFLDIETIVCALLAIVSAIIQVSEGVEIINAFASSLIDLFYFVIWIKYFEKSRRCEVYFSGKDYLLSSIFTKSYYNKHYRGM